MDKTAKELPSGESNEIQSKVNKEEDISKKKGAEYRVSSERSFDNAIIGINAEDDQRDSQSLPVDDQQVRHCTRTGVLINLENARKRSRKAGMAVKSSISLLDNLLREQCTDIVKLTSCNGGLSMDMDNLKRFQEEVMNLLLSSSNDDYYGAEDQRFFDDIRERFLECSADVKTRLDDLAQERQEMFPQRSRISGKSRVSRLSRASSMSSKQSAANAAALKEKMLSVKRKQEMERYQEELKQLQRELEWQTEQEQLLGEINAAEVLHQTLLEDSTIPCNNTHPKNNPVLVNIIHLNMNTVVSSADVVSPCTNIQLKFKGSKPTNHTEASLRSRRFVRAGERRQGKKRLPKWL